MRIISNDAKLLPAIAAILREIRALHSEGLLAFGDAERVVRSVILTTDLTRAVVLEEEQKAKHDAAA